MTGRPPIHPSYCHGLSPTLNRLVPLKATDVHKLEEVDGYEGQDIYFYLNHPIKWVRLTGLIVAVDEFFSRIVYTLDDSSGATIEATCRAPPKPNLPKVLDSALAAATDDASNQVSAASKGLTISQATAMARKNREKQHEDARREKEKQEAEEDEHKSPDGPNLKGVDVGSVVIIRGKIGVFRDVRQVTMKSIIVLGDTNAEVKAWRSREKFKREVLAIPWAVTTEEEARCRREAEEEPLKRQREKEKAERRERRKKEKEREEKKRKREKVKEVQRRMEKENQRAAERLSERSRPKEEEAEEAKQRQKIVEDGRNKRVKLTNKPADANKSLDSRPRRPQISMAARLRAMESGEYDALGF